MAQDHQRPEGLGDATPQDDREKTFMGGGKLATRSRYLIIGGLVSIVIVGGLDFLAEQRIVSSEASLTGARVLAEEIEEIEKAYWQMRGEERGFLLSADLRHIDRYQKVSTSLTARLDALFAHPAAEGVRDHVTTVTEGLVQHGNEFRGVVEAEKALDSTKPGPVEFIVPKSDADGPTKLSQDEINRLKALASSTEAMMEHEKRTARLNEVFTYMNPSVEALIAFARQRLADAVRDHETSRQLVRLVLPTSGAAVLLLFTLFSLVILRSVSVPARTLAVAAVRLAEGDDAIAIPAQANRDELGDLARALAVFRGGVGEVQGLRDDLTVAKADLERTTRGLEQSKADLERSKADREQSKADLEGMTQALEKAKNDEAEARRERVVATSQRTANRVRDATAERISAISRQVAQSGHTLSTAAYEAERTDALIHGLGEAASRIGDAQRLLGAITDLAAEDAGASALKGIRTTTNQASLVVKEVVRTIERVKGMAVEIADASSTHALETTTELLEKSEHLRDMLGDLVNRIRGDEEPST